MDASNSHALITQIHLSFPRQSNDVTPGSSSTDAFTLNVNTRIPLQGITAIFGKSGSGKSTLLRCIAGLEPQVEGKLQFLNEVWLNEKTAMPAEKRNIGFVFQEGALFDHLNVRRNLEFAIQRTPFTNTSITFPSVCSLLNLQHLLEHTTAELSGGERQRVAIGRALLSQPKLLLMDEPLASLDAQHKAEILPYLETLEREYDIPILYVSHSLDEVIRLTKNILILEKGNVAALGLTHEILSKPEYIRLQGDMVSSVIQARVCRRDAQWKMMSAALITSSKQNLANGAILHLADTGQAIGENLQLRVLARDVSITLENNDRTSILNRLPARIINILDDRHPAMRIAQLEISGQYIFARITKQSESHLHLHVGQNVWAQIKSVALLR